MASTTTIKQFDVYWAELDPTNGNGSEIQKTRPCVILSPDEMNAVLRTVMVVPLTSTIIDWPFRTTVTVTLRKSSAACDHLRVVDKQRLSKKLGVISPAEQRQVIGILQAIFRVES